MFLWDTVIDAVKSIGTTVADKLWMDKDEKEQLAFSKVQFAANVKLAVEQMVQDGQFKELEAEFKEHDAQRNYAQQQFGSVQALAAMGWIGKLVLLGRASIRWVITGGFSYMTYQIVDAILPAITTKLATGGTLTWIEFMILAQIIGVPLFYVCGVSIEKWLKVRNS
jgi:hypothetical protein